MTSERDELRLAQELPEDQVSAVIAAARRRTPVAGGSWQPAFFASAAGDGESIADTVEDLLERGFGR